MSMQINIQHVFNMSASRTHACFESHTPLVNGCVDDVLFNAAQNVQQIVSHFVNISNLCLVNALLHCSPDFVIHQIGLFGGHCSGEIKSGVSRRKSSHALCAEALSC